MKYILELEDEPNKEYFGEGNYYRCKQIPYWSISESMRNRLEPYDEADRKTENSSEKLNNSTRSKMEQVDKDINVRSKDKPQICDTCRYYNSNIPCGSTPSACKEADKFAEEFVDGLKKLKPKDELQTEREGE